MDKTQLENDTDKYSNCVDISIFDPKTRIKCLSNLASAVEINRNIPIRRYYRSGAEMIKMAEIYESESYFEYAYVLYVKFVTIFVDKIRDHPGYQSVPAKEKTLTKQSLRDALVRAEDLKQRLAEQYEVELIKILEDAKKREKTEKERLKHEEQQKLKADEDKKNKQAALAAAKATKTNLSSSITMPPDTTSKGLSTVTPKPIINIPTDSKIDPSKDKKIPTVDRSTKPALLLTDTFVLRDIILPSKLMKSFLALAFNNTVNNKETCGILAGKLERNKLAVTHLLIPQQTGSADSCSTHNEEDIFDYQDQHNLITLGWIHTHPTQTAFLSSVDLHTHCSYQLMMAEAIAIVCAPKYDETGFFILTPDYGLDFIANCKEVGFHPHPTEPPLYMKAKHCKLDSTTTVEVIDLRKK